MSSSSKQQERVMFACHLGSTADGHPVGLLSRDFALPIAVSASSEDSRDGLAALWEEVMDAEAFFRCIGLDEVFTGNPDPAGVWVYETEYAAAEASATAEGAEGRADVGDPAAWTHLAGGKLRRPLPSELVPLLTGRCPWDGGVVL